MENIFEKYTNEFLTFKDYKNNGLNGIALYPAMMIDEMQKCILEEILKIYEKKDNLVLLDPFHGAGTTLLIAKQLGVNSIGFDINPLANLITKAKLYDYDRDVLLSNKDKLFNMLGSNINFQLHNFDKINKWFRSDIIEKLSKIRFCIMKIENKFDRLLFWTIFSNVVRKFSNSRSSTFKLHIKEKQKIDLMNDNVIFEYKKELDDALTKLSYDTCLASTQLFCGDSLKLLDDIKSESIDIICTSPPYGDNSTTVTYGQFSSLALRWIPREDLDNFVEIVDYNYSSIDKLSLGGSKRNLSNNLTCLENYLQLISSTKKQKIINFTEDYIDIFEKLSSKIKKGGYIILTLGNRKVDNKLFPFVKINDELATMYGFSKVTELKRDILRKRIAKKVSSVDSKAVESMSEEYILIYKKEGEDQNA